DDEHPPAAHCLAVLEAQRLLRRTQPHPFALANGWGTPCLVSSVLERGASRRARRRGLAEHDYGSTDVREGYGRRGIRYCDERSVLTHKPVVLDPNRFAVEPRADHGTFR